MATGNILIKNPNGRNGTVRVITIDSNDDCDTSDSCVNQDITFVDPQGNSGVVVGGNAIFKIVDAGGSGVKIAIDIQPN